MCRERGRLQLGSPLRRLLKKPGSHTNSSPGGSSAGENCYRWTTGSAPSALGPLDTRPLTPAAAMPPLCKSEAWLRGGGSLTLEPESPASRCPQTAEKCTGSWRALALKRLPGWAGLGHTSANPVSPPTPQRSGGAGSHSCALERWPGTLPTGLSVAPALSQTLPSPSPVLEAASPRALPGSWARSLADRPPSPAAPGFAVDARGQGDGRTCSGGIVSTFPQQRHLGGAG